MPPTDPTPTPTPREVLAQTLARCREYGGTGLDEWLPRVVEAARADERAALAATGDAPLSETLEVLTGFAKLDGNAIGHRVTDLLTAYTTLAAQLAAARAELFEAQQAGEMLHDARREIAALRAERDALRERLSGQLAQGELTISRDDHGCVFASLLRPDGSGIEYGRHGTLARALDAIPLATPARPTDTAEGA